MGLDLGYVGETCSRAPLVFFEDSTDVYTALCVESEDYQTTVAFIEVYVQLLLEGELDETSPAEDILETLGCFFSPFRYMAIANKAIPRNASGSKAENMPPIINHTLPWR